LPYIEEFIGVVHEIFTSKTVHFSVTERYMFQLDEAFAAAVQQKDPRLKDWLNELYDFCTYRGFAHFYVRLTEAVERLFPGNGWVMLAIYCNRALILQAWGRLEEAMTLHQKEEAICEELGDRAGLAITWWNQGLIHKQKNNPNAQARLWKKAIDNWHYMGIPSEKYEKSFKELMELVSGEG
jgi:tetratricopeptide (TPR) repeat protein